MRAKEHFIIIATSLFQEGLDTTNNSVPSFYVKQRLFAVVTVVNNLCLSPSLLDTLPLFKLGYSKNRFPVYQSIAQQAERGKMQKVVSSSHVSVSSLL